MTLLSKFCKFLLCQMRNMSSLTFYNTHFAIALSKYMTAIKWARIVSFKWNE